MVHFHQNVVEGLYIRLAVLNGNTIAKSHALDPVVAQPQAESALINRRLSSGLFVFGVNGGNLKLLSRMTMSPSRIRSPQARSRSAPVIWLLGSRKSMFT